MVAGLWGGMLSCRFLAVPLLLLLSSVPALAADDQLPYWASLREKSVNMRVGPGEDYRINWRYRRQHLPMKVLRTMDGWRLVQDPDGARGWMLARFLKRERGAIVQSRKGGPRALAPMLAKPEAGAKLLWRLEPGVTGKLGDCADGWCRFDVEGQAGYVRQAQIWGPGEP
ncbi:MAG: SH3 domain-containing protein [Pseudomonadota bacterium]